MVEKVTMVDFTKAYFIKLGRKGGWEKDCIEGGTLRLGFMNPFHQECVNENYDSTRQWFENENMKKRVVTSNVNQVKTFYDADEHTLWITFYQRQLWWGFATPGIEQLQDGSRIRKINSGWKSTDACGNVLSIDKISDRLTQAQRFQGTICNIKESKYLREKVNGVVSVEVEKAKECLSALIDSSLPLIKSLTWKDFELLADLLFVNAGWKRIGVLGKTERDIDIDLLMPVSGKRAFVQVKSSSTQAEFEEYLNIFLDNDIYDEMYFVVHTTKDKLLVPECGRSVRVISDAYLAKLVATSRMTEWLIEKAI